MSGEGGRKASEDDDQALNEHDEAMTCSVLCSLGSTDHPAPAAAVAAATSSCDVPQQCDDIGDDDSSDFPSSTNKARRKLPITVPKCCPKQLQLPMFLSKTYHMIDKCEPEIATWSESGDNFVVKNVERFAGVVLPLYFKHANFSSFARQLNFYGFRKLRSEAILTAEVDPGSACYVRFYHENFQRDKPDLLAQIKRATKTDQQAKDDVDSLRLEIYDLKGDLRSTVTEFDRKVAELSFEHNRHLAAVNAKYDKLSALVQSLMCAHAASLNGGASNGNSASLHQDTNQVTGSVAAMPPPACINYLHSLSEAAVSLQDECEWANTVATAKGSIGKGKRHAPENGGIGGRKKGASRLKR